MPEDFSSGGVLVEEKPDFSGDGELVEKPEPIRAVAPPWLALKPTPRSSLEPISPDQELPISLEPQQTAAGNISAKFAAAEPEAIAEAAQKYGEVRPVEDTLSEKIYSGLERMAPAVFGKPGERKRNVPPSGALNALAQIVFGSPATPEQPENAGLLHISPATLMSEQPTAVGEFGRQGLSQVNLENAALLSGLGTLAKGTGAIANWAKAAVGAYFSKTGAELGSEAAGRLIGDKTLTPPEKGKAAFDIGMGALMAGAPLGHTISEMRVKPFKEPAYAGLQRRTTKGALPYELGPKVGKLMNDNPNLTREQAIYIAQMGAGDAAALHRAAAARRAGLEQSQGPDHPERLNAEAVARALLQRSAQREGPADTTLQGRAYAGPLAGRTIEVNPPEQAEAAARLMQQRATAGYEAPKPPRAAVPGTPAGEQLTVLAEIRQAGAKTKEQVQQLFPGRGLTREEAAHLRDLAWSDEANEREIQRTEEIRKRNELLRQQREAELQKEGVQNATGIRENQGQLSPTGEKLEGGKETRGPNLEQPPSVEPEPLEQGKGGGQVEKPVKKKYLYNSPYRPIMSISQYLPEGWELHGENTVAFDKPLTGKQIKQWELEPLDPNDPINIRKAYETFRAEMMDKIDPQYGARITLKDGRSLILSENIDPKEGNFRITHLDKDGTPTAHNVFTDFDEAIRTLWGWKNETINVEPAKPVTPAPPAKVETPGAPGEVGAPKVPTLLEFAKSKLPKNVADKLTDETQVESFRAQYEKEFGKQPTPPAVEGPGKKLGRPKEENQDLIDQLEGIMRPPIRVSARGEGAGGAAGVSDYGELVRNAKGRAKKWLRMDVGMPVDEVMQMAEQAGLGRWESTDAFLQEIFDAGNAPAGERARKAREAAELGRDEKLLIEFQDLAFHNKGRTAAERRAAQSVQVGDLKVGDSFSLKGEKVTVKDWTPEGDVVVTSKKWGDQNMHEDQYFYPDGGKIEEAKVEDEWPDVEYPTVGLMDLAPDKPSVEAALKTWHETGKLPDGWAKSVQKPYQIRLQDGGFVGEVDENHPLARKLLDELPFLSEAPKLRPGEKGTGDLLQGGDQPFNLAGEKGTDAERIAAEKAKAEQAAKDRAAAEAAHPNLPGTAAVDQSSPSPFHGNMTPEEIAEIARIEKELGDKLEGGGPIGGGVTLGFGGSRDVEPSKVDPDFFINGGRLAYVYVKAGAHSFEVFGNEMIKRLGERARPYLLSWYNNIRQLKGAPVDKMDAEPVAQKTYETKFGGKKLEAAGAHIDEGGKIRHIPRVVRPELIQQPKKFISADTYSGHAGFVLDFDQIHGINAILTHFENNPERAAFLLGDGTGFGKTAQILGVIDQYRKRFNPNARILYVTQNKQMLAGSWARDAKAMGIDLKGVEADTYNSLKDHPNREFDLVIFDEAHNLKNGESAKSMAAARVRARHKLFATATPMDKWTGAAYFLSEITGVDELEVARKLGFTYQQVTDPYTQAIYNKPVLLPGANHQTVVAHIVAYRDAAIGGGAMLRREYPFYGEVLEHPVGWGGQPNHMAANAIMAHFDRLIESATNPRTKRNYSGQKTLASRRWSEISKVQEAFDLAKAHLDAGGQVIIMAETDKAQNFPVPVPDSIPALNDMGRQVYRTDGALSKLHKMFDKAGIKLAHIHDTKNFTVSDEVDKFQSGEYRVALATPKSGGAGINLDDVVGGRPRLLIVMSPELAADVFDQVLGRVSRKTTQSKAKGLLFNNSASWADQKSQEIQRKKLATLRAIQGGQDVDVAGIEASDQTQGYPLPPESERPPEGFPAPGGGTVEIGIPGQMPTTREGLDATIQRYTPGSSTTTKKTKTGTTTITIGGVRPTIPGAGTAGSIVRGLQTLLGPTTISQAHLTYGEKLRKHLGAMHQRGEASFERTKDAEKFFAKLGVDREGVPPALNEGIKFMSAMATGSDLPQHLESIAGTVRAEFERRIKMLQDVGAPLSRVRENYFPGMWEKKSIRAFNLAMADAEKEGIFGANFDINNSTPAQRAWVKARTDKYLEDNKGTDRDYLKYLSRRPMKGSETFRKPKVFDDIMDAAEFGLRPISNNPIDLVRLKLAEMDRSIMANGWFQELKRDGDLKVINPYEQVPQGWVKVLDKYGTIFGKPMIEEREYVDRGVYLGLLKVARELGIRHERKFRVKRGALGLSWQGGNKIQSQFATPLSVLAHELSHQIDHKFDLWKRLVTDAKGYGKKGQVTAEASQKKRGEIMRELRALADLSWEGRNPADVSESYKKTVRQEVEQMAHLLEAYIHAREKFQKVAPTTFTEFENFLKSETKLKPLTEIRPGISLERLDNERYVGLRIMGYRIVPEEAGAIMNNYLSSSLYNNPHFGLLYKGWMGMANALNQSQLGWGSFFHAGFTTGEAQVSANANIVKDVFGVLRGNRSIDDLSRSAVKGIASTIRNPVVGDKVLNAWRERTAGRIDPKIAQVVRAAQLAGGGFKMESGLRTRQAEKAYRDWYSGRPLRAAARSPLAGIELMAKPVMDWLVPRQKAGVFADLAWRIIEQNPGKSLEELTHEFSAAWNRVDARLGQVRYDRLFLNNIAKNVIQAAVRAPGWSGGTIAELGGGFKDAGTFLAEWYRTGKLPQDIPDRTAYVISLILTIAAANSVLTYAFTGTQPKGLDIWAFRTGKKDEEGREERFLLPTYMKDVLAYSKAPGQTLLNKSHPLISMINEVAFKNRDYYGVQIRDTEAGPLKQAVQAGQYVVKSFEPFWTRGARKEAKREAGVVRSAAPLLGVMPAPPAINNTAAENLAADLLHRQYGEKTITREQFERSQERKEEAAKIKRGEGTTWGAVEKGIITPRGLGAFRKRVQLPYLDYAVNRLSAEAAVKVYVKASPEERARIRHEVSGKISRATAVNWVRKQELRKMMDEIDGQQPSTVQGFPQIFTP